MKEKQRKGHRIHMQGYIDNATYEKVIAYRKETLDNETETITKALDTFFKVRDQRIVVQ